MFYLIIKCIYSGNRLMWSLIMSPFGLCAQFDQDPLAVLRVMMK